VVSKMVPLGVVAIGITPYGVHVIEVHAVTKRYGEKIAVDDLSFSVSPGLVTGFLGPNGAGKSTTMRLILGLDSPSSGTVTVNGRSYRELSAPLHEIGAMLEAHAIHTGRSAYSHLLSLAQTHAISRSRVEEVIELVGLGEVARKRVGSFSLGMGQRLGVAAALLGDPHTVILDEPANGLDPEGIHWIRNLLKGLAAEGRTVFLSSHLMSEMSQTADHLIVIGRGRLIADTSVAEFVRRASSETDVRVRSPRAGELGAALARGDAAVQRIDEGLLEVTGLSGEQIGEIALEARIVISELTPRQVSLEEAFMSLTGDSVEYRANVREDGDETDKVRAAA
jgi:ABC-2 type transport system ATP-binding protein